MENDLGPPAEDAMMTSEKRIEIGTTWPSYHSPGPITYAWKIICKALLIYVVCTTVNSERVIVSDICRYS